MSVHRTSINFLAPLIAVLITGVAARAENVTCDPSANSTDYFCRGWQDGVGKYGSRVHFIARMLGDAEGDDFGFEIVPLGDINSDGRDDFMVSVRNQCEWRIYLGDTLIAKQPYMVWPKSAPPYPCDPYVGRFFSTPDISGDGQPDLFRSVSSTPGRVEIYFAGTAFDTIPDLTIHNPDFIFPGGAGNSVAAGLDLNGDGEPDFVLGDPNYFQLEPKAHGRAYAFWGGSALDTIPDLIFTDTFWTGQNQPGPMGRGLVMLPSINGDASAELVIGRESQDIATRNPPGRVDVYFGGPAMDTVRDFFFISPDTAWRPVVGYGHVSYFGGRNKLVGDFNQDGYDDLLVTGPAIVPVYIYYGGPGFDTSVYVRLSQPWPAEEGENNEVTALGDVNGDGYPDLATVYYANQILGGWVRVHFSSANQTGVADWDIAGDDWAATGDKFGRSTRSVGDVNGDGFDDFAIGMETSQFAGGNSRGGVYIFAGYNPDVNTGVFDDPGGPLPSSHSLIEFIAPNPFNSATTIRLSESFTHGMVTIYDILGRPVRTIAIVDSGNVREVRWDATDEHGSALASGLYFARASDGTTTETHKIVLLK